MLTGSPETAPFSGAELVARHMGDDESRVGVLFFLEIVWIVQGNTRLALWVMDRHRPSTRDCDGTNCLYLVLAAML